MDILDVLNNSLYTDFIQNISKPNDFVIASISSSPALLAKVGLLKNKNFTVGLVEEARSASGVFDDANYLEELVVQDGNLLTAWGSAFIKGVTQSNIYKRLEPNKPACTIVNPRKCLLMPPHENRILTVRECARLFSLPDTFVFKGPLDAMQQQVANGTCVNVIKAIAKQVKDKICAYNALLKRSKFVLV